MSYARFEIETKLFSLESPAASEESTCEISEKTDLLLHRLFMGY